jgi:hypothetical protein
MSSNASLRGIDLIYWCIVTYSNQWQEKAIR